MFLAVELGAVAVEVLVPEAEEETVAGAEGVSGVEVEVVEAWVVARLGLGIRVGGAKVGVPELVDKDAGLMSHLDLLLGPFSCSSLFLLSPPACWAAAGGAAC